MPTARSPVRLTALAVLAVGVLAGCSSAPASPSASSRSSSAPSSVSPAASATSPEPSSSASSGSTATAASERCTTSDLTARLVPGSPGAGQRYATVELTNAGRQTCTVLGYGGIGLYASDGSAVPTHQVRVPAPAPKTVLLQPGHAASSQLHWSVVAGTGDAQTGNCQPVAATLRVIPPDETTALSVPWAGGPVCEGGRIDQQAYTG